MGVVYRAKDNLDRIIALKVPRRASDNPKGLERFRREAMAASRINNPPFLHCPRVWRDWRHSLHLDGVSRM